MAITVKSRDVVNYNAIGTGGKPKQDQYLDFVDDAGNTVASLAVPASGATPSFEIDAADAVTDDTVAIKEGTATLTDAMLKSVTGGTCLYELQPAPGDGMVYDFHGAIIVSDTTAGAYLNINSTDASIDFSVGAFEHVSAIAENNASGRTGFTGIFASAAQRVTRFAPVSDPRNGSTVAAKGAALSASLNEPLYVQIYNGDGELTGGHADNFIRIVYKYSITDLSDLI
jgi:hypothetical protein